MSTVSYTHLDVYKRQTLSWIEKKVASTLGSMPIATHADVVASLMEAENLNPTPWKENKLLLAKSYIYNGDYQQAVHWLEKAAEVPSVTPEVSIINNSGV